MTKQKGSTGDSALSMTRQQLTQLILGSDTQTLQSVWERLSGAADRSLKSKAPGVFSQWLELIAHRPDAPIHWDAIASRFPNTIQTHRKLFLNYLSQWQFYPPSTASQHDAAESLVQSAIKRLQTKLGVPGSLPHYGFPQQSPQNFYRHMVDGQFEFYCQLGKILLTAAVTGLMVSQCESTIADILSISTGLSLGCWQILGFDWRALPIEQPPQPRALPPTQQDSVQSKTHREPPKPSEVLTPVAEHLSGAGVQAQKSRPR